VHRSSRALNISVLYWKRSQIDAQEIEPGPNSPQLYERDASGNRVNASLQELIDRKMGSKIARADLFISQTRDGGLLITSRQDDTIQMLVPD
jgi:hypothetical protein